MDEEKFCEDFWPDLEDVFTTLISALNKEGKKAAFFHPKRSLNNTQRDRLITFMEIT